MVPAVGEATIQDPATITRRDTYWVGAGLGVGANLISLRVASTAGLFDDEVTDYGLLYGRATRGAGERHLLGFALGVAVVDGCGGGGLGGCQGISAVIRLPLELQAFWRPGKLVGLGLYGFANLNEARSFAGVTLGLQLGRLR